MRAVMKGGRGLESEGRWDEAVECYQKALDIDGLAEDVYYRLMTCYRESGNRAEALSAYKRCRSVLTSILHIEPSARTEALYKAIISEDR